MDQPLDVVVVGGAGVDSNVYLQGEDIDWSVESNFTRNVDCVGQAGGYASRLFARLGVRTGYLGPVGDDHNGGFLTRPALEARFAALRAAGEPGR
jgi:acarbose 7IV-phosphotransferase